MIQRYKKFVVRKKKLGLLLKIPMIFEWHVYLLFLLLATVNYYHIWLRLMNTLIPQITNSFLGSNEKNDC